MIEKKWSGRRDSNPRRPAWEINHRLKIQSLAFTASLECDTRTPCFQRFAPQLLKWSKSGAKDASQGYLELIL